MVRVVSVMASALARRQSLPHDLLRPTVIYKFAPQNVVRSLKVVVEVAYHEVRSSPGDFDAATLTAMKWGGLAVATLRERFPLAHAALGPVLRSVRLRWPGAEIVERACVFRQIMPDGSTTIYWHMDADGAGVDDLGETWNCWLPLEDVGFGRYPSLEIIEGSEAVMRRAGPLRPGHREDAWVAENFPGAVPFRPQLRVGDAVVFSHWLLHRTEPMGEMAGPRIGCELRFAVPGAARAPTIKERVLRLVGR